MRSHALQGGSPLHSFLMKSSNVMAVTQRSPPVGVRLSVEVVLCTFNGASYLAEQLSSILSQTRAVDQISVYDDGSSDDTAERATSCLAGAEGIAVNIFRNQCNLGYALNFAQGLERARSDVVLLCDQDDIWEPTKVERLLRALDRPGCMLAFCDGRPVDATGQFIPGPSVLRGYGLDRAQAAAFDRCAWSLLLRRNFINGAAMALRRVEAQKALPIPDGFPHDYWLALWLARPGAVVCVDEPLYRYRLHGANIIGARHSALHHQLRSIWRAPALPRQAELRRALVLRSRLAADDPRIVEVDAKLRWLSNVVQQPHRLRRLTSIALSLLRGDYRRLGSPYAAQRDIVAAFKGTS